VTPAEHKSSHDNLVVLWIIVIIMALRSCGDNNIDHDYEARRMLRGLETRIERLETPR
jgi:hypothetical protein